jgi:hypothetical protein
MTEYWNRQDQELDRAGHVEVGPAKAARDTRKP